MKISKLIEAVGDANVQYQWLSDALLCVKSEGPVTRIEFGTLIIGAVDLVVDKPKLKGIIIWLPADNIPPLGPTGSPKAFDTADKTHVFDGSKSVLVPKCCNGNVKSVTSVERILHRNKTGAAVERNMSVCCVDCGKILPSEDVPEPKQPILGKAL